MKKTDDKKAHYIGHRKRLRERYIKGGIHSIHEYEALELLLTYGIAQKDVKPVAKELLKRFNGFQGVFDAQIEDLIEVDGIGKQTALLFRLVKDLCTLYLKEKQLKKKRISSPEDIMDYLRVSIGSMKDEQFMTLFLNARNEVVAEEATGYGTVDHAVVYPRKVFENALRYKAVAMILVHNHPGGSLKPSARDIELTRKLKTAADGLGIKIHDHLIVTNTGYISFYEKGLM